MSNSKSKITQKKLEMLKKYYYNWVDKGLKHFFAPLNYIKINQMIKN